MIPADSHVHSEWSWDAVAGSMWRTCARAVEIGLPAVVFSEHADFTPWTVDPTDAGASGASPQWYRAGVFTPPELDLAGYRNCLDAVREAFPSLRILSGVELSEPHWHPDRSRNLLESGRFDRVLASVHARREGSRFRLVHHDSYQDAHPEDVVRAYLSEVETLAEEFAAFDVLAHIDFPVRYWPGGPAAFNPEPLEGAFRAALAALARSGRILEVNTEVPLSPLILSWWCREGGQAITFGSDAHDPDTVARGFREAAAMAEAHGFQPGRNPHDPWPRR